MTLRLDEGQGEMRLLADGSAVERGHLYACGCWLFHLTQGFLMLPCVGHQAAVTDMLEHGPAPTEEPACKQP